jgi:hypothetical protein
VARVFRHINPACRLCCLGIEPACILSNIYTLFCKLMGFPKQQIVLVELAAIKSEWEKLKS